MFLNTRNISLIVLLLFKIKNATHTELDHSLSASTKHIKHFIQNIKSILLMAHIHFCKNKKARALGLLLGADDNILSKIEGSADFSKPINTRMYCTLIISLKCI